MEDNTIEIELQKALDILNNICKYWPVRGAKDESAPTGGEVEVLTEVS